jgi:hypothetical protein
MAGYVHKGTGDADGRRIGAELGLGEYLAGWDGSELKGRVVLGWVLIGICALGGIGVLESLHGPAADKQENMGAVGGIVLVLAIAVPLVAFPWRIRRQWLHHYEGGVAQVTGHRRRVSVVRWSDLASMSLNVVQGYDDERIDGCVLRDHVGNAVSVNPGPCKLVVGRAEQVLTGRLVGPLTGRLDAGLPVTVGCLTVDQSGIRCRGGKAGGRWNVSWQQVHDIETRLRGHRVTVTGHRISKRAALAGEPNDFLAEYVLQHAARRVGVRFNAW